MKFLKSPLATYLGMAIAVLAMIAGITDVSWISSDLAWTIAGFFGFGSVASLRLYIEAQGWKTYVSAGVPMVASILFFLGVVVLDQYQALLAVFGPITAATVQHALSK